MTKRIPQPRTELPPNVRVHEAKLLAVMLRTSRLTWVFGEPGTDKSALLRTGVMPLLQRRHGDRGAGSAAMAASIAAPERRRLQAWLRSEVAIHFDSWGQIPLSALKRRIASITPAAAAGAEGATLAETLRQLHQRLGLHFVFLLDRFEDFLAMAADEAEVGQFADELVEAILQDTLPVSFLISMDEAARPRLERFRARIPGFDHDVLRLSPVSQPLTPAAAPATMTVAVTKGNSRAPHERRPPPRERIKVEDVYALIESRLSKIRAEGQPVDRGCDVNLSDRAAAGSSGQRPTDTGRAAKDNTADPSNALDRAASGGRI